MLQFLVMDVDGTLTDGRIHIGKDGEIFKSFNAKDGCGLNYLAKPRGLVPVIITGRNSEIVAKRCAELGITSVYQGVSDKKAQIKVIVEDVSTCAYIGDDLNDLDVMRYIREKGGILACPSDAAKEVKEISHLITEKKGGYGCVREFIEWLIEHGLI